jgi:Restriction endonuclease
MVNVGGAAALSQADALDWREFESLVQLLLESKGFVCWHVGDVRDHGADILAIKGDKSYAVQVKHRRNPSRRVGRTSVEPVLTATPLYNCDRGIVITNATFADEAKELADVNRVMLRDRAWLETELASHCVLCGERVSGWVREWCADRPHEFGGNTYCVNHQRHPGAVLRVAPAAAALA